MSNLVQTCFYRFGYASANTAAAAQAATTTHLQNQDYNICVRRDKNYCVICWADWYYTAGAGSFGLSLSPNAGAVKAGVGTQCSTDYITVSSGMQLINPVWLDGLGNLIKTSDSRDLSKNSYFEYCNFHKIHSFKV